jgi:hypothetical protein
MKKGERIFAFVKICFEKGICVNKKILTWIACNVTVI